MVDCQKEEHSHSSHDDALGNRVARMAVMIRDELKTACRESRKKNIRSMAVGIINETWVGPEARGK